MPHTRPAHRADHRAATPATRADHRSGRRGRSRWHPAHRTAGPGMGLVSRSALQVVGASFVVITATAASPVPGPGVAEAAVDPTAEAVAAVWRGGAAAALGTGGTVATGADAVQQADAVAAELLAARGQTDLSRSTDRSVEPEQAPTQTGDATAGSPADEPSDSQGSTSTGGTSTADLVEQARQQVQRLALQQVADDTDAREVSTAPRYSAAQARDVVAVAQEQRAADAAAAALAAAQADPRSVAVPLVAERGWDSTQFACLDQLWTKESGWSWSADNPTSSAYGIPQALPGPKMASHGADWETSPTTQITWGLDYIADVYGTPCSAWSHSRALDWY